LFEPKKQGHKYETRTQSGIQNAFLVAIAASVKVQKVHSNAAIPFHITVVVG